MPSPYGMEIVESCLTCKLRAKRSFCDLPPATLQAFEGIKYATAYPRRAALFVQGQLPRGIFVLCKGSAKLAINSPSGRTVIVNVAEQLSEKYHKACKEVRWLGLSHSATEKLANLLLEWSSKNRKSAKGEPRLKLRLTQKEIAQMMGLSRETVARVFADFRKQRLIQQNGSTLVIPDRVALKSLITN